MISKPISPPVKNSPLRTIKCPSCLAPVEYDMRDYCMIKCECGCMFRPPPIKRKGGYKPGKRRQGPPKVPVKLY